MVKRRYFEKIPLQGNVYPIPTAAYVEDERSRFTLLTAQPLGAGSMEKGKILRLSSKLYKKN